MKYRLILLISYLCLFQLSIKAQDEEFNMNDFQEAGDVKSYCTNKVIGLSPSKLISLSFDAVGSTSWNTVAGNNYNGIYTNTNANLKNNSGLRLETNYPLISKNSLIFNAYLNYWESHYQFKENQSNIANIIEKQPLSSTVLGAIVFKPIDKKKFFIFQADGSMNGNYNFVDISPDFTKIKFSGSVLYGWKRNENTNLAFGITRTFRGGRTLHIPVILWNKTFNEKWGVEMLFPARAAVRRNFSTKTLLLLGYELEGQSYHIQSTQGSASNYFNSNLNTNDWELRKSEFRVRLSWEKAITDFVWFNLQMGAVINYRYDIDESANKSKSWLKNEIGTPLYFRFGIQLVSP